MRHDNKWRRDTIIETRYPKTAFLMWIFVFAVIIGCLSVASRETPLPTVKQFANAPANMYDCEWCHNGEGRQ